MVSSPELGSIQEYATIRRVLDAFRAVDAEMPLNQALVFIEAAERQGTEPHLSTIIKSTGLPKSTVSRYIRALSTRHYRRGADGKHLEGLGLIRLEMVEEDLRYRRIILTARGKTLVKNLLAVLGGRKNVNKVRQRQE